MQKISLKSVKEFLSRDEMRKISGGSNPGPGGGGCNYPCQLHLDCPSACPVCKNAVNGWGWCGH